MDFDQFYDTIIGLVDSSKFRGHYVAVEMTKERHSSGNEKITVSVYIGEALPNGKGVNLYGTCYEHAIDLVRDFLGEQ